MPRKTGPLTPAERQRRRERRAWLKAARARRALARAVIESGYRQQARTAHPDGGGSAEALHALQTIRDALLRTVSDTPHQAPWGWLGRILHIPDEVLMGSNSP